MPARSGGVRQGGGGADTGGCIGDDGNASLPPAAGWASRVVVWASWAPPKIHRTGPETSRATGGSVITVEEHGAAAVVRLDRGKVNALDLELLQAITATMARLTEAPA